jgi:D-alanyl-lipoteichoic acid acyltransferase DltB (MBOAT superfamily)
MLFPTVEFAIFFLIVFFASWLAYSKPLLRKYILLVASYFFYGYWDWRFALLLFFCSYSSYWFGKWMSDSDDAIKRKRLIIVSTALNLGILGFFKYYGFFVSNFNEMLLSLGIGYRIIALEVILPVGISFFTFQAMSYVIDVYRNDIPAAKSPVDVLLYVSFFPQLVAGPIVRASEFLPQLYTHPEKNKIKAAQAATLILGGLFKKVVIANYLAIQIVDPIFQNPLQYSSFDTIFGVYAYAVQIYCDFSAYSDIAIGIALLFGYEFTINFNHPYRSLSIQEFWRRWHISLSSWLRDYLYIPLGGNKKGRLKTYRNLLITMFLGGLWHGAAWNFVLWGALHGTGLAVERYINEKRGKKEKTFFGKAISFFFVFNFVCLTWVFFRADSFSTAMQYLESIVKFDFSGSVLSPLGITIILYGIASNFTPQNWGVFIRDYFGRLNPVAQAAIFGGVLVLIGAFGPEGVAPFIYFQF